MTAGIVRSAFVLALALAVLLGGSGARGQMTAGFDLTLVDVDGARSVPGQLPPSVYAPRITPDGRRVAFETRDPSGSDGARLWIADLSDLSGRRPLPRVTFRPSRFVRALEYYLFRGHGEWVGQIAQFEPFGDVGTRFRSATVPRRRQRAGVPSTGRCGRTPS